MKKGILFAMVLGLVGTSAVARDGRRPDIGFGGPRVALVCSDHRVHRGDTGDNVCADLEASCTSVVGYSGVMSLYCGTPMQPIGNDNVFMARCCRAELDLP
jgi:hypothetical protein